MMQHAQDVFVPAQPARHARLFELIRQDNLSRTLEAIVDRRPEDQTRVTNSEDFLAVALSSLRFMPQAA